MNFNKKSLRYYLNHWKIFIHLLFRTKRFGVNNNKLSVGQIIKGWRHYHLDERDGMEVWQVIKIDENNSKVKFLGYEYP